MKWQNLPEKKIIMDDFNNPDINWLNDTSVHGLEKQLTDTINGFLLEHLILEYRGGHCTGFSFLYSREEHLRCQVQRTENIERDLFNDEE